MKELPTLLAQLIFISFYEIQFQHICNLVCYIIGCFCEPRSLLFVLHDIMNYGAQIYFSRTEIV